MPIGVKCACKHEFSLPDHFLGRGVRCPACGINFQVPAWSKVTNENEDKKEAPEPASTPPSEDNAATLPEKTTPNTTTIPQHRFNRDTQGITASEAATRSRVEARQATSRSRWVVMLIVVTGIALAGFGLNHLRNNMAFEEHLRIGDGWLQRGYPKDAEQAYAQAEALIPDHPDLRQRQADLARYRAEHAEKDLGARPSTPDARRVLERLREMHRKEQDRRKGDMEEVDRDKAGTPTQNDGRMAEAIAFDASGPHTVKPAAADASDSSGVSRLAVIQFVSAGPWSFAVSSFESRSGYLKKLPLGQITIKALEGKRIALIGLQFSRLRDFTLAEEKAIQESPHGAFIVNGRKVFLRKMFIHSAAAELFGMGPPDSAPFAISSPCLTMTALEGLAEASLRDTDFVVGYATKETVKATFAFGWDPAHHDPILVFTPVPGIGVSKAARLHLEGATLISVEYGDAMGLCEKHWPKGMNIQTATPIQGIEIERKEHTE